jgi:misacylated tRNA(Ala) deacylase
MTALFVEDAYLSTAEARVTAVREDGGIIARSDLLLRTSGGQPGDTGFLERENGDRIDHRRHGHRRHQGRDHP